jgi:hypothetical protein
MEATLGISLYSYLYLKLAKMPHLSYWRTRGQNRFCLEVRMEWSDGERERGAGGRGER